MAIELIDKIKQKNNGTFKLMDAVDVELSNGKDVETAINELIKNGGNGVVGGCFYVGSTPPEDTSLIWIDTSGKVIDQTFNSIIIDELRAIISTLTNRILELEARVSYLEINGGGGTTPSEGDCILLEDGSLLLLEDGGKILLETQVTVATNYIQLENGDYILTESGNKILKESE